MKKKNVVVTLAAIAISAVPLMAQQISYTTPNNEVKQEIKKTLQSEVLDQQAENVIDIINEDINSKAKYERLLNDYKWFLRFLNDESLDDSSREHVGQTLFVRIDDLAQSILNLPVHAQPYYIKLFTEAKYNFKYTGEIVTLSKLYDYATSWKTIHLFGNTAIEKILNENQRSNKTNWNDPYLKGVLEGFEAIQKAGK